MYHSVISCCVCLTLLLSQFIGCFAAPTANRHQRSASEHHGHQDKEVKLTLVLDKEGGLTDEDGSFVDSQSLFDLPSRRQKRDTSAMDGADFVDLVLPGETDVSPRERRTRRSAAWWMHAVVQLCNSQRHMCRRIEVDEGSLHMKIRLEEY